MTMLNIMALQSVHIKITRYMSNETSLLEALDRHLCCELNKLGINLLTPDLYMRRIKLYREPYVASQTELLYKQLLTDWIESVA